MAPAMIMMAEKDGIIPLSEGEEMAEMIPGADLVIIPGVNHSNLLQPGGIFLDNMMDFFSRIDI
jgi:pimeloyl-ACP methyl ester carboxylesterase